MNTREVRIGNRVIGGGSPVLIQSMTNTKTEDVQATVAQIKRLTAAGCEIIRCAVPTMEAAKALGEIKRQIEIPLRLKLVWRACASIRVILAQQNGFVPWWMWRKREIFQSE